jgi:hypothetical protein
VIFFRRGVYVFFFGVSPGLVRRTGVLDVPGRDLDRSRSGVGASLALSLFRRGRTTTDGQCFFNDPSAGSPTDTLLRLLLPLNGKVRTASGTDTGFDPCAPTIRSSRRTVQSVGATGGVYKGQGRNQRELMTRAY